MEEESKGNSIFDEVDILITTPEVLHGSTCSENQLAQVRFLGVDACELVGSSQVSQITATMRGMSQEGQKVIVGQCLPTGVLFEEFARNDEI